MNKLKLLKIIAAMTLLLGSTAGKCEGQQGQQSQPGKGTDNKVKDCFSDTGSDKPMFVNITMAGGSEPWEASGYARDAATGNKVDFHEIITSPRSFTRKLMYISGCKVVVWLQVKNNGPGFAFIRADDGSKNGCREEQKERYTLSCEFTTKR